MELLHLFRFSTFVYLVEKISKEEGCTDAVRRDIWTMLDRTPGTLRVIERIVEMDSMERLQALSHLINYLKTFAAGNTRVITNQQWVARIDRVFKDAEDDDDDDSPVTREDVANSTYGLLAVNVPGGGEFDFLGNIIIGCNLVSLDSLFFLTGIPQPFSTQIRTRVIATGNFWRVKCPLRGIELFLDCHEAATYCRGYCLSPKAQQIIRWLDGQPHSPPDDTPFRRRFHILEAVDSTEYVITFLGAAPSTGHLVLLRASDGHVHVASFMKACIGLPVTELEVWDDHCEPLSELLKGPVTMRLATGQIDALTIPIPAQPVVVPD